MSVSVPEEGEKTEKSLAMMIKAQYTMYDSRNVLGHTEIPKRQIPAVVMMMTLQEILHILSSGKPKRENYGYRSSDESQTWDQEQYAADMKVWNNRNRIENDELAMLETISDRWIFSFGLCMRSVDRKIRLEGVKWGTAAQAKEAEDNLGVGSKILQTLGLGKLSKYKKVYVRKDEST